MQTKARIVTVFGSSQVQPDSAPYNEAKLTGGLLARAGCVICSGGYAGVMEAASRGAKEAGGRALGVTVDSFVGLHANAWLDEEIRRPTFMQRLETLMQMGHAYLALHGGIGTLTEISTVWSLLQTHSIPPRPLVLLTNPWQGLLDYCAETLIIRAADFGAVQLVDTPDDAVQTILRYWQNAGE
jgi:uncharacterized protein (TIGR00730 family)